MKILHKMKIFLRLAVVLLLVSHSSNATESTFISDSEGWIIIDHDSSSNPLAMTGVNFTANPAVSGGRLVVQDIESSWNWIVAPEKFHQSWADFNSLEIDLITDDAPTIFSLIFFIADGANTASFEFPLSGTPGGSVLNLSAPLVESEWEVGGNWEQLITNVNAFFVRIDLNNNVASEADFVDRIALVDGSEPPSQTFPVCFATENNCEYQLESSVDLQAWRNVGQPVLGNGSDMIVDVLLTDAPNRFFRARTLEK